jgi:hypothetical protein
VSGFEVSSKDIKDLLAPETNKPRESLKFRAAGSGGNIEAFYVGGEDEDIDLLILLISY